MGRVISILAPEEHSGVCYVVKFTVIPFTLYSLIFSYFLCTVIVLVFFALILVSQVHVDPCIPLCFALSFSVCIDFF